MKTESFSVTIRSTGRAIVSIDNYPVYHHQITFLFGESGIGKSLVSKAVYGLLDPDELRITVNGKTYGEYLASQGAKDIKQNSFFVFQEPSSHLNALLTLSQQIREGSLNKARGENAILHRLWGNTETDGIKRLLDIYPKPYRPSGGEKQRVLLAMAFKKIDVLLQSPGADKKTFFVFDEPTGSLDNNYRNLFLELLFEKYSEQRFTILIITHDYSIISEIYRKYRVLLPQVHFKEFMHTSGSAVEVVDFSADEYLNWLQKAPRAVPAAHSSPVVLNADARFKIFDRDLCIYKDESHRTPADLVIHAGEMVYVKAPSGVGKTTLAKIILGLYAPQKFSMTLGNLKITQLTAGKIWAEKVWGKKAGMVFQHADEALNLQATVKETFDGLPLRTKSGPDFLKNKLLELFEGTITDAFLKKKVAFLSGGQKQRLNLLRTLALGTDLIILDEPLNGLDFVSVKKVLALLEQKRARGTAILMISHNEEIFDAIVGRDNVYYLA